MSKEDLNSFLPTIRTHQFSDSFKGFTFVVEKKVENEIKNIFLHDKGNNLKNLSSNVKDVSSTTILAKSGFVDKKRMFLFNGQIISSKKDNTQNEVIKFEQLNIDLNNFDTATIKQPKLQETSTLKLMSCFINKIENNEICKRDSDSNNEIISSLNRRIVLPFYIPIIALICSLLLIKSNKHYYNKYLIFLYGFSILVFTELVVRYTGINTLIRSFFTLFPISVITILYFFLIYKFSKENKST